MILIREVRLNGLERTLALKWEGRVERDWTIVEDSITQKASIAKRIFHGMWRGDLFSKYGSRYSVSSRHFHGFHDCLDWFMPRKEKVLEYEYGAIRMILHTIGQGKAFRISLEYHIEILWREDDPLTAQYNIHGAPKWDGIKTKGEVKLEIHPRQQTGL